MKAIHVDAFVKNLSELKIKDVPTPEPTNSNDLQIKITHASLTHVDQLYAQGLHQNNRRHVKPPFILGNEWTGRISSATPSSRFKQGERVMGGGLGAYAEHIVAEEYAIRKVPDGWNNAEACAVGSSGAVSYGALFMAGLKEGESALILGASGGLGVMAVQIAKAFGAKVFAVVGGGADSEKAKMVRQSGADEVVSYREPDWEDKVKSKTEDGEGVHVVFDAIGAVRSALKCLRYRGRIVIVGFAAREGEMEEVTMNRILLKSATVHGYRFGEDGRRDPQSTKAVWDGFLELVNQGSVKPVLYQQDYVGLEAVHRGLQDVKDHRTWGRAVVSIDSAAEQHSQAKL